MQTETRQAFTRHIWRGLVVLVATMWAAIRGQGATRIQLEQLRSPVQGPGLVGFTAAGIGAPILPGPGVSIENGFLNVKVTVSVDRRYNVQLTRDGSGNYAIPPNCQKSTVIWRNGLRQQPVGDYNVAGAVLTPVTPWAVDDLVLCDGE